MPNRPPAVGHLRVVVVVVCQGELWSPHPEFAELSGCMQVDRYSITCLAAVDDVVQASAGGQL
eukprot:scaffold77944_cov45-Prasinocladus_malaysianus.AAC.1